MSAFPGLNLSWEVLEGLAKHNGPVTEPGWALAELDADFPLDLARWPSLEAQVAALADDIAYDNHDIDDGLRSGFLALDELLELDFVAADLARGRAPLPRPAARGAAARAGARADRGDGQRRARRPRAPTSPASARSTTCARPGGRSAAFSPAMAAHERQLKTFLYQPALLPRRAARDRRARAQGDRPAVRRLSPAARAAAAGLARAACPRGARAQPPHRRLHRRHDRPLRDRALPRRSTARCPRACPMSEPRRVLLVGATGLVGTRVMEAARRAPVAAARRADPARGADAARRADGDDGRRSRRAGREAVAAIAPDAVICALGTTWRAGGQRGGVPRGRPRPRAARWPRRAREARGGEFRARLVGRRRRRTARRSTCGSRARSRPR